MVGLIPVAELWCPHTRSRKELEMSNRVLGAMAMVCAPALLVEGDESSTAANVVN